MGKIIISREEDKGSTLAVLLLMFVTCLIGGVGGIPIGAILSMIMMAVLHNNSPLVVYGFWALPIVFGMILAVWFAFKNVDLKNHTRCTNCRGKMQPTTELDSLFFIPAEGNQSFENPFLYLAQNMTPVSSIRDIPPNKRGCYVCCYRCPKCSNRIIRIADFLPKPATCQWKKSYYFDYQEFVSARGRNDL